MTMPDEIEEQNESPFTIAGSEPIAIEGQSDNEMRVRLKDGRTSTIPRDHPLAIDILNLDLPINKPTKEMIKAEAGRRILARYPDYVQRNMIARSLELVNVKLSGTSTQGDEEALQLKQAWDWIKTVRERSNELEQSLPVDYANDSHWPEAG
jgi:hypothetical protein